MFSVVLALVMLCSPYLVTKSLRCSELQPLAVDPNIYKVYLDLLIKGFIDVRG